MTGRKLNRQLTLEAPVRVADGAGGFSQSWTPLGTLWAEVTARSGREMAQGGQPASVVSYRIVVRGAPVGSPARPMAEQRFREGSRVFGILAVTEADGLGKYLTCYAQEEVAT